MRFLLLLLFCSSCFAGGDYSVVKVNAFDGYGIKAHFTVEFVNANRFDSICDQLEVFVQHKNVPWYAWGGIFESTHPSRADTEKSILFLKTAFLNKQFINFGYMGLGLKRSEKPCVFISKGLKLETMGDAEYILSFHNPV